MTRAGDLAIPVMAPHPLPPGAPVAGWPGQLRIGVERLPQSDYVWDDEDQEAIIWAGTIPGTGPPLCAIASFSTKFGPTMGATNAMPKPSGTVAGDLLIAYLNYDITFFVPTYTSGWTQIGSAGIPMIVLARIADGGANDTLTVNGGGYLDPEDYCCTILRIVNHTVSTVSSIPLTSLTGSTAAPDTSGVGTGTAGRLFVAAAYADRAALETFVGLPAGYAEVATLVSSASSGSSVTLSVVQKGNSGTTAENPAAFTLSAPSPWGSVFLAVPGAGGGGTPPVDVVTDLVWDAPFIAGGLSDVICDFQALTILTGHPDDLGLFGSGTVMLNLDNRSGAYSQYDEGGRLVYFAPGRQLAVWAHVDGADWWLFNGRIDRWTENSDDTVTVEASDGFNWLAREIGPFTPGAVGNAPKSRILAIAAAAGFPDRVIGDAGHAPLTRQLTDRAPLEEMQVVALSDGGLVHCDADGSLVYRDRLWPSGRLDQTRTDVFTDNVCTVPHVVTETEMVSADDGMANWITLTNVAGTTVTVSDTSESFGVRYTLTHPDPDQWTDAADGTALANTLLQQKRTPTMRVGQFQLQLMDPHQDLWRAAIDCRLGDKIEWIHDYRAADGTFATMDVLVVVTTIDHEITPELWVTTMGTSRAFTYVPLEYWDRTRYLWDSTDPKAIWRY